MEYMFRFYFIFYTDTSRISSTLGIFKIIKQLGIIMCITLFFKFFTVLWQYIYNINIIIDFDCFLLFNKYHVNILYFIYSQLLFIRISNNFL
jgi:hypothetical protein